MRWVKGRSLVLYTCVMDDTEVPRMILKNSKASNSYSGVVERSLRWRLPLISDKQQKRPISTLTTDHKTCMITGISRKYPICPIFSKVMLKFTKNFSITFAENRTYGVPEFAGTEVNRHSGKLKGLSGYLQIHHDTMVGDKTQQTSKMIIIMLSCIMTGRVSRFRQQSS